MEITKLLSINLKKLRTERELSLGQLSALSGVSKVMISQIEKGDSNPTINIICKIANGLKVPYTTLLEDTRNVYEVKDEDDAVYQTDLDGHFRVYTYYSTNEVRNFEFFRFELDQGFSYTSDGHISKLIEYIMVIEGELTLLLDEEEYVIGPNQSISAKTFNKHTYSSTGDKMLKAICIGHYSV